MSHSLYEIELGGQAAAVNLQSLALLDNTSSLTTLVSSNEEPSLYSNSYVIEDEGDVFQCGRCKKQFNSLVIFMHHKREGCSVGISSSLSREYVVPTKYENTEVNDGHYLSGGNHLETENVQEDDRSYNTASSSVLSSISLNHHQENHDRCEENAGCETSVLSGATPVIHFTPSIVLGEETLSFTIPIDQNSGLAHLFSGANSSSVLSIPENELAAFLSAGEQRYHLSVDPSNPMNTHSIYLTASLLPSNDKESSELKDGSDSPQYVEVSEDNCEEVCKELPESQENSPSELPLMEARGVANVIKRNKSYIKVASTQSEVPLELRNYENQIEDSNINGELESTSYSRNNPAPNAQLQTKSFPDGEISNEKSKGFVLTDGKRKCEYCGKLFKKLFNLHQHIRSHTGEKPFHCLVCGRGFTQKSNVKKHMQTHKVWPKVKYTLPKEQISVKVKASGDFFIDGNLTDSNSESLEYVVNNVYVCQYCDQHFENYHKLKTHLSHTHKNEKLFKCIHKDCLATFLEVEGLICHMKSHEDQIEYQCQNCPKKFKNLYDLGAHQHSHRLNPNKVSTAVPKQFRCTKCNSKYASSEALNHHLLTSSHNYPCSQCSLTFVCERYLRRHLRIHGTVEPFKCDLCGKMFKTENYLKSHSVIHSDKKPFHCEICKQSFNRRDKLTRHKLMHDNRKKYKCPFKNTGCEREFYRKDKLKDHMISHSRKVYFCQKCGKNFSWPQRLRQHQIDYHPEMLVATTCPTCQKIFKTRHHLKIHICSRINNLVDPDPDLSQKSLLKDVNIEGPEENELVGDESVNKIIVLYNDCNMEVAVNNNGEKSDDAMLGSYNQTDDPEGGILAHYSDCEDRDTICPDHDVSDEGVMGPMEMAFESGVNEHIDPLL